MALVMRLPAMKVPLLQLAVGQRHSALSVGKGTVMATYIWGDLPSMTTSFSSARPKLSVCPGNNLTKRPVAGPLTIFDDSTIRGRFQRKFDFGGLGGRLKHCRWFLTFLMTPTV